MFEKSTLQLNNQTNYSMAMLEFEKNTFLGLYLNLKLDYKITYAIFP